MSLPGAKVALEADGPTHIARTDPKRILGAMAMKRRHLSKVGWSVINVTFLVGGGDARGGHEVTADVGEMGILASSADSQEICNRHTHTFRSETGQTR